MTILSLAHVQCMYVNNHYCSRVIFSKILLKEYVHNAYQYNLTII